MVVQMGRSERIQAIVLCSLQPEEVAVGNLLALRSEAPADRSGEYKLLGHPYLQSVLSSLKTQISPTNLMLL